MHETLFMTNSYLEKDYSDISIVIEFIILSWVKCILGTKYLPAEPIRYPKAKLTLSSISWLAVQYKMGILRLAFIFCCIRSWMALHVRIKTYYRVLLNYTRTLFTPVNYHLRLQCLYNSRISRFNSCFPVVRLSELTNAAFSAMRYMLVTFVQWGANRYQLRPLVVLERRVCSLGPSKPVVAVWVPGWSR
jgi:hypothetical protein